MAHITLLYPAELIPRLLKVGEVQEYKEVLIEWNLPFFPMPGDRLNLESFLNEKVHEKAERGSSYLWRVSAVNWEKGENGSVELTIWVDA